MTEQPNQDNGTLVLALIAGLSINGTFDALFSSVVTFSIFPIISLVLAVYCLHVRYHRGEMPKGLPVLAAACFLLGLVLYSTIVRAEYPELGSNFLPSLISVALVFMVRNLNRFFQRLLTIFFNANQPEKQGNSSPDA